MAVEDGTQASREIMSAEKGFRSMSRGSKTRASGFSRPARSNALSLPILRLRQLRGKGSDTVVNGYDGVAQSTTSLQVS